MLTAGVVLCVYNGTNFIEDQLASIAAQTRKPDELLVVDDCSTDDTPRVVERFAAQADFPVRLEINDRNLGYVKNFGKGLALSRADIIMPCDHV